MKAIKGGATHPEYQDLYPKLIKLVSLYLLQTEYIDFEEELIRSYAVNAWNYDEMLQIKNENLAEIMETTAYLFSELPNKEAVFKNLAKAKANLFPNTGLCVFSIEKNETPNAKYEHITANKTIQQMVDFCTEQPKQEMTPEDYMEFDEDEDFFENFDEYYEDEIIMEPDGEINRSAIVVKRKPAFHDWLKFVLPGKEAGPENIYLTNECIEEDGMIESLLPEIYETIMYKEFESFIDDENNIPPITLENFHRYFYLSPHNMVYDLGTFDI